MKKIEMEISIKVMLVLAFAVCINVGFAQQDAHFTQFMYNQAIINPAFTGSEANLHTALFYRNQWTKYQNPTDIAEYGKDFKGFNQSPKTITFSTHSAFGGSSISGGHPMGAGLNVVKDELGLESRTTVTAGFAYHIEFESEAMRKAGNRHLFFGLNFGMTQFGLNTNGFNEKEAGDQVLNSISKNSITPELGAGILFKNDAFYIGASAPHLLESKINYSTFNDVVSKQSRHYYGMIGFTIKTKKDDNNMNICPNVLVKYLPNTPLQYDVNLKFSSANNQAIWFGVSYRSDDAVGAMAGINLAQIGDPEKENRKILLGYAFDYTISKIPSYNTGSHEIMLIFDSNLSRARNSKYDGGRRSHERHTK